ncbi:acyl-protein synthetase [Xylaria digitata]|nr:acyl-protein synthetase [Xylaria digitata]
MVQDSDTKARSPASESAMITIETCRYVMDILRERADFSSPGNLLPYPVGGSSLNPKIVSYSRLYAEASKYSLKLANLPNFSTGKPVLLHLEDHWDTILCNVEAQRRGHLKGLSELLDSPICIIRATSLQSFEGIDHTLQLNTGGTSDGTTSLTKAGQSSLAILMLTSGSTGNAKAVSLTHQQILAAVSGKAFVRPLPTSGAFLSWIGLDHVASLVEGHLQALWLGVDQVHVHAADIVASPKLFLDLLSRHRVSRSFAPNFFLAKLLAATSGNENALPSWDLSTLAILASGGEANDVSTCVAVSALLERFGAPHNVLVVGFGMTKTCAGAIFNTECPDYDVSSGQAMASMGRCMPGIEMRVMSSTTGKPAESGETGELELRGVAVFKGYYNNPTATAAAFTLDGWFRTGDRALIDSKGNLHLAGRLKDVININGVKIATPDVQASVEAALRDTPVARVVCFPSRAPGASTEQVTVSYVPKLPIGVKELAEIDALAIEACVMVNTSCRPLVFSIMEEYLHLLPKSTLGKISAIKMSTLVESGMFDECIEIHRRAITEFKEHNRRTAPDTEMTPAESLPQLDFAEILGVEDHSTLHVDAPLFELGFTSMDLIRLKTLIDARLGITVDIVLLLKHPTIRSLAASLDAINDSSCLDPPRINGNGHTPTPKVSEAPYDPVVVLRSEGSKTPLWLVHPVMGEILVFVGLAKHMKDDDRPIYALRARGIVPGQSNFTSMDEVISIYVAAVRRLQPNGPYAIAGLNSVAGTEVRFLGNLNRPPYIRGMSQWNMCLLQVVHFLGLVTEEYANQEVLAESSQYREASKEEALNTVLLMAGEERMKELGMTSSDLLRWVNTACALRAIAADFDPSGSVQTMDIFHAEPLKYLLITRQQWVTEQLSGWRDFCQTELRFHAVGGTHDTMLGPDHVASFSLTLKAALKARGL